MEDSEIIALFFARDEEAIHQTDLRYGARLRALAERIVRSIEDAQENVNDTYFQAWQTIPPQHPAKYFAYLAKICRNFALDTLDWRSAAKRSAEIVSLTQELENCIPDTGADRDLEERELGRLLDTFLAEQSKENRMLFVRRYFYADSVGEIAKRFGMKEGTVSARLHRTREKLANYLSREGIAV